MIQELRLGNYFKVGTNYQNSYPAQYGKVTQVYMEGATVDYHYPFRWFEPIPLSPEILEKCGFVLFPWGWVIKASNDFGIRLNVNSFSYDVSGNNPVKIQFLHELQNLYYALTKQELIFKP